jgi:hypothetical protein
MPKGNLNDFGQFFKDIGKLLGNAQIPALSLQERRQNCPATNGKTVAISVNFF